MMSAIEAGKRNPALDFTKGALMLLMVLYHWINYFVSPVGPIYTHLRFITPSFIFITGFVITNIYPARYEFDYLNVSRRLFRRGIKLLAIFTALNVLANLVFATNYRGAMPGVDGFFGRATDIYVSGNAKSSFSVLLPISYLLLMAGGVFRVGRGSKHVLYAVCGLVLLCVAMLNLHLTPSANLEMLAFGLVGIICGAYPIERINSVVDHPLAIGVLYLGYTIVIAIWGVPYALQVLGVCLNVGLIYLVGVKQSIGRAVYAQVVIFGKYSLFGYIAQIGALHFLHQILVRLYLPAVLLWAVSFMGAFIITVATVNAIDIARKKFSVVNSVYGAVFS